MDDTPPPRPDEAAVIRFAADLDRLADPAGRIGIAVSGGPDSLALLLLAAAARPGLVEAASVDHGLRPESRNEAEAVASLCDRLAVPHRLLAADEPAPVSNLQAWARELRYRLLGDWGLERDLAAVATGHQLDDQAETLLMRLARGSGIGGLAGVQRRRLLRECGGRQLLLVRPLLGWRRSELAALVEKAGLRPVADPSNRDPRFDRSRARALLERTDWIGAERIASAAAHCFEADEALQWAEKREYRDRVRSDGDALRIDPEGLPPELRRRILLRAFRALGAPDPAGPKLMQALERLESGGVTTLGGLKLAGGKCWILSPAPPRREESPQK